MSFDSQILTRLSGLIEQRTGMAQGAQSPANLEAVLRELGGVNPEGFLQTLAYSADTSAPWQTLLNALFIGETYFLRNRGHFSLLRDIFLPEIIAQRGQHSNPSLNIWSAGCASGEETYSLAITLHQALADLHRWTIRLIGTDINHHALRTAEQAVYRAWSFRHTDADFQAQYFSLVDNGWQLKPFIREMVVFRQRNLLVGAPMPQADIIFCCNVLLYFEESSVQRAETMFFNSLAPGGRLVLGQAEALRFDRERWQTHIFPGAVVYQKPADAGRGAVFHKVPALPANFRTATPEGLAHVPKVDTAVASAPMTYAEAVKAVRIKQYDEAERVLADILRREPEHVAARVLLGCVLGNRRALPEAHRQLDDALKRDPLRADAHYLKGVLYTESQQSNAAREAFRSALYCQRGHPLAAMLLGHLYLREGEDERARHVWREALNALDKLPATQVVSDLSDWTVEGISEFLSDQIEMLE